MQNTFQKKIVLIAKEKFGSQKLLAESLNLKPSTITEWVSGRKKPSFEVLKELCLKAEISLDWLVLDKDMSTSIDYHDLMRISLYIQNWATSNNIEVNEDLLTSIYLTFEDRRKETPNITINQFLDEFGGIYKKIKFNN